MKKGVVLCVTNQKGGVGKTTFTQICAHHFHQTGLKVLVIDTDPQSNLTLALKTGVSYGANKDILTTYDLYEKERFNAKNGNIYQTMAGFFLLPNTTEIAKVEKMEGNETGSFGHLQQSLQELKKQFNIIVIDSPPSQSSLLTSVLKMVDQAIIITDLDEMAMMGATKTIGYLKTIRGEDFSKNRTKVLVNKFTRGSKKLPSAKSKFGSLLFQNTIPVYAAINDMSRIAVGGQKILPPWESPKGKTTKLLQRLTPLMKELNTYYAKLAE